MSIQSELDKIDAAVSEHERAIELLKAKREGVLLVRAFAPAAPRLVPVDSIGSMRPKTSGRQKGAISKQWQDVLRRLYTLKFPAQEVATVVRQIDGRQMKLTEIRRVLATHAESGLVEKLGDDEYIVTEAAAVKYGFEKPAAGVFE